MKNSASFQGASQRGIALLEALVALVILALTILALASVQARVLVDARTTKGDRGDASRNSFYVPCGSQKMSAPMCGDFTLNQAGVRGLQNNALHVTECWGGYDKLIAACLVSAMISE